MMRDLCVLSIRAGLLSAVAALAAPASAQLFNASDIFLAVDSDVSIHSNFPGGEGPGNVADQNSGTKYLNFGKRGTGVILTPAWGSSTVQSMRMTTANDAPARDPATWELYGTNDPIVSTNNSDGSAENWVYIAAGAANLPETRQTQGPVYDFTNAAAYTSYKIVFPSLRDGASTNSMQVADISLFTGSTGGGSQILAAGDAAVGIGSLRSDSDYPGGEAPRFAFDQNPGTKYLNFGRENTGVIMTRADGEAVTVQEFTITTANDSPSRDPSSWELYGTDDVIVSTDNSTGDAENWTLIDSGSVDLPVDRQVVGPTVQVNNSTAYTSYKILFPTIRDPAAGDANSMQIADIEFDGEGGEGCPADINNDGLVDFFDVQLFLNYYSAGDDRADIIDDDFLDFFDVQAYLNLYAAGCP